MRKKQERRNTLQKRPDLALASSVIRTLKPPATGNKVYWDSEVAGFGMRVTANDAVLSS